MPVTRHLGIAGEPRFLVSRKVALARIGRHKAVGLTQMTRDLFQPNWGSKSFSDHEHQVDRVGIGIGVPGYCMGGQRGAGEVTYSGPTGNCPVVVGGSGQRSGT